MTSRRTFLTTLAVAAAAPAAVGRAVVAEVSPILRYPNPATITAEEAIARWARQCGGKGNPAWILYHYLTDTIDPSALDRESFARLAAYCDEPVTTYSP